MHWNRGGFTLILVAVTLLLAACKTYPEPTFLPPPQPSPPANVINLYRALKAKPLPVDLKGGLLKGFGQPAAGYLAGEGLLLSVWPARGGHADGLYLADLQSGKTRLIMAITPGAARDVATASAIGSGYFALQIGPESGPRYAPVLFGHIGGAPRPLRLPAADRRSIATSLSIRGSDLLLISTRSIGVIDHTNAVDCALPAGLCRNVLQERSNRSDLNVIAISAGAGRVYAALKPADPGDAIQGEIVDFPCRGGKARTVWRTSGVLTAIVAGPGFLAFTEDFGIDEGLYLRSYETLIRVTPPSVYPSNPSYGDGYLAWWAAAPQMLDIRTDRLYTIPGFMPEIYGNVLTYLTQQGLRYETLPNP